MKNITLILFLLVAPLLSRADLITEGEVKHRFAISNLEDYPEYEFYILYQTYYYDRGYQEGAANPTVLTQGEYVLAGARGAASAVYMRKPGEEKQLAASDIQVGGSEVVPQRNARYIRDTYEIEAIDGDTIRLKLVEQNLILADGKEIEMKKGGMGSGIEVFGIDLIYIGLPVVCLLGIVFFFMYRRRQSRREGN